MSLQRRYLGEAGKDLHVRVKFIGIWGERVERAIAP